MVEKRVFGVEPVDKNVKDEKKLEVNDAVVKREERRSQSRIDYGINTWRYPSSRHGPHRENCSETVHVTVILHGTVSTATIEFPFMRKVARKDLQPNYNI